MPDTAPNRSTNLIWIDLEMTGLCTQTDTIIEIATVVTDKNLAELAVGPVMAIRKPTATMDKMDEWNTRHHGNSGLTARVLESSTGTAEAEQATLNFLREWVDKGASPMSGNSICQDRRFLAREMPDLERFFHYRNLDVSTLKILASLWAPQVSKGFQKDSAHLALSDIRDSIEELSWYRENLLSPVALAAGKGGDRKDVG
jgi:oligoribonuclease